MLKRAFYLCLVTSATLMLLACGGKKDEDALMEDEGTFKPAASAGTAAASCQSGRAPRASLMVAKAIRKAMKVVASKISRSENPAVRSV